jgi:hypothetical protein
LIKEDDELSIITQDYDKGSDISAITSYFFNENGEKRKSKIYLEPEKINNELTELQVSFLNLLICGKEKNY